MLNNVSSDNSTEELKELIKKNIKISEDIHDIVLYVKKYIFWSKIFSFLKIFIILIPIIISIIYLPPLLRPIFDQYKKILEIGSTVNNIPSSPGFVNFLK